MIHAPTGYLRHLCQEGIRGTVIGHKVPVNISEEAVIAHIVGEQSDQHIPSGGIIEHSSGARLIPVAEMCRCIKIINAVIVGKGLHSSATLFCFDGIPQGRLTHELQGVSLDHIHLRPRAGADRSKMVAHLNVLPIQGIRAADILLVPQIRDKLPVLLGIVVNLRMMHSGHLAARPTGTAAQQRPLGAGIIVLIEGKYIMPAGNTRHHQFSTLVIQTATPLQPHISALAALRRRHILYHHIVTDCGKGITGIDGRIHDKRASVIGPLELISEIHGQHREHCPRLLPAGDGNDRAVFCLFGVFIVVKQWIPWIPCVGVQPHQSRVSGRHREHSGLSDLLPEFFFGFVQSFLLSGAILTGINSFEIAHG